MVLLRIGAETVDAEDWKGLNFVYGRARVGSRTGEWEWGGAMAVLGVGSGDGPIFTSVFGGVFASPAIA